MFEVNNGITQIDGLKGKYDQAITNPSEKYAKNAIDNFYNFAEQPILKDTMNTAPILDFGLNQNAQEHNTRKINKFLNENDNYLNSLPPLEFEYRYMPNVGKSGIDKNVLLAEAKEEMGQKEHMSVEEMDNVFAPSNEYTSKALDINNDGKITKEEYSTSFIAADMLSKSDQPDIKYVDGSINSKGMNAVLEYSKKSNLEAATKLYTSIYNKLY